MTNKKLRAESPSVEDVLSSKSSPNIDLRASPTPSVPKGVRKTYRWVDLGDRIKKCQSSRRSSRSTPSSPQSLLPGTPDSDLNDASMIVSEGVSLAISRTPLRPALDNPLHPHARMLFEHFAQYVAPVMVVLNSESNGYRDVILPLACQDLVLGRAVSVAATFHLAQKVPSLRPTAEAGHHAIIEKLRRDSLLLRPGEVFNRFTLATVLVLLVGETITGADNYGYLLEMLECFTQALGTSLVPPGLDDFFRQQIKMFQLFGLPLANEKKGLQVVTQPPEYYFEFMAYPHLAPDSSDYNNLNLIRGAIWDACSLYRRRAESSLRQDESAHLVEQLRQKVDGLGLDIQGSHSLVWACFIAAAESTIPEHRMFFSDRLVSLYTRTGFGSIPAALEALKTLWAMDTPRRWTDIIATDIPVLVM